MFRLHLRPAALAAAFALALLSAAPAGAAPSAITGVTITVDRADDVMDDTDGTCSLPEAIIASNTNEASGPTAGECAAGTTALDTITVLGVNTITLSSPLPAVTAPVIIDGSLSMPRLRGGLGAAVGFTFNPGSKGSKLTNFRITDFSDAAVVLAGGGVTVAGNFFGDSSGTPPVNGTAVRVQSSGNIIGTLADMSLFEANQVGVDVVSGSGNLIQGNTFGSDPGNALAGNVDSAIHVQAAAIGTLIGGTKPGQGNLISGSDSGVLIDAGAQGTKIQRNAFGIDPMTGILAYGNRIAVTDRGGVGTVVGGALLTSGNLFAAGHVGVEASGTTAQSNITISGNVFGLGGDGVANLGNINAISSTTAEIVTIKGNLIANSTGAAILFSQATLGKSSSGNCLHGNAVGVINGAATPLALAGNWWGAPTGPNTPGADTTSGPVTAAKWLTKAPKACQAWAPGGFKPASNSFAAKSAKPTKLSWGKVSGVGAYQIWMYTRDDVTAVTTTVVDHDIVQAPTYTTPAPLAYGRYFWEAQSAVAGVGFWRSPAQVFYVTIMKTPKPGASVRGESVKFTWGASSPAPSDGKYQWRLYSDAACGYNTGGTNVIVTDTVTGLSATELMSAGSYWWSVSPSGGPQMDCWPVTVK